MLQSCLPAPQPPKSLLLTSQLYPLQLQTTPDFWGVCEYTQLALSSSSLSLEVPTQVKVTFFIN